MLQIFGSVVITCESKTMTFDFTLNLKNVHVTVLMQDVQICWSKTESLCCYKAKACDLHCQSKGCSHIMCANFQFNFSNLTVNLLRFHSLDFKFILQYLKSTHSLIYLKVNTFNWQCEFKAKYDTCVEVILQGAKH